MADSFTHLHVHTEYSILDGASRISELIDAAVQDNQPGIGITDHGNMYGALEFYKECNKAGIKPIIGTEAYMAKESRHERPTRQGKVDDSGGETSDGAKLYYHLTLLAISDTGYKNLMQVASRAFLEGYYYKPRCDWETLSDHADGLIAASGCLGAQVPQALLRGDEAEALERAARLQDIFGPENFFIELHNHGLEGEERIQPGLLEIARKLKAPLLATNDSHYTHKHDAVSHDALLCVQTGSQLNDADRFHFHGNEYYLKTAAEMRRLFSELEVACDNTLAIAERADVNIEFGEPKLPRFPLPEGFETDKDYLEHLTLIGAKQRWGDQLPEAVSDRLAFELDVINRMGFASYFLITWDIIAYARKRGIRVGPGRGSAAGCAVAYALQITDLDPIRYDLLFERFLNPDRVSMPDIDMDFDSRYRDDVINYAAQRYGRDHVAQIITFGRIKARAAVRDAARVLGHQPAVGDKVAKAMPPLILGRDTPLKYCLERSEQYVDGYVAAKELRQMIDDDSDIAQVVDVALGLENLCRQDSVHAAAVVITPDPLTDYMPIQRKPESGTDPELAPIITQYEMHGVEELGLLKMDFLGLRNLDVISDCLEMIKQNRDIEVDIDNVDLDDDATYELLQSGETAGIFQLESTQVRNLIRSLAPTTFDDVAALVALYRPGPMAANMHNDYADRKNGRKKVTYVHDDAADILEETYGLMIYQENVMRIAQRFAGYSLAEADLLRKAMGKKIREAMATERERFISGVANNGYDEKLGKELFDIIEDFADYAFNKSHSYGYGLIAYQTAYLKANYSVEYLAALLRSVKKRLESASEYLNECQRLGIEVTVPDINVSNADFTPIVDGTDADNDVKVGGGEGNGANQSGRILYGLSAIRNVGTNFSDSVIAERDANGPFQSFVDFLERLELRLVNKRSLESLIKAGAFDAMGYSRLGLMKVCEETANQIVQRRKEIEQGVMSLFEESPQERQAALPELTKEEYDRAEKLAHEKEMIGMYLSDHPLNGVQEQIRARADATVIDLEDASDGDIKSVGGVITKLDRRMTKTHKTMANFILEDMSGNVEVTAFPRAMDEYGEKLLTDAVVIVRGRVETREEVKRMIMLEVSALKVERAGSLQIQVVPQFQTDQHFEELREILSVHPGKAAVKLCFNGSERVAELPDTFRVDLNKGIKGELLRLFGEGAVSA